ncbi:ImmA/IrrE family metallo-endopeptidase [Caballeronia sp. GAFFF2]|uniref:ImmA/IrrE family metallo-endopeptidase n=1 Tax=Caballeronia sp. GAFFF2 TaxID=2921741 RepID=UPI002027CF92|nr:ImmA/IrrE family metallo-endopeptidase [Caballeronia sp. GAFFF2]
MDHEKIEQEARRLHYEIWHKRKLLFPFGEPEPAKMCAPDIAARVLDIDYEYRTNLGAFRVDGTTYAVAGILDRRRGIVSVATRFGDKSTRFTGAHEIGHHLLHPGEHFHRDRPLTSQSPGKLRPPIEREADYFAACFLASRRLTLEAFSVRFGRAPLMLDDNVAFHLKGAKAHELMRATTGSGDFAAAVASARSFNGRRFPSLADHFGLSVSAMAHRLQELDLVLS